MSHVRRSLYSVPLGIASVAAQLQKETKYSLASIEILNDYPEETTIEEFEQIILSYNASVICFSMTVWNRTRIENIVKRIKEKTGANAPTFIVGGPEVSANLDCVRETSLWDELLVGEGENCVAQILGTPSTPAGEANLEELPSPWLSNFPLLNPLDYEGLLWELARGCPFKCSFCYESKGSSRVRHFPMERIRAELKLFKQQGVNHIFVLDPTFNYDLPRAKSLLNFFLEEGEGIHFCFEARAEFIDEELASLMAEVDCSLQIGLQSAIPSVLKEVNRPFDKEKFVEHIHILDRAGVIYGFDLIFGLPTDTFDGFLESLQFSLALRPNHLDIFRLSILPSTQLAEEAIKYNICWQKNPPYLVQSTPTFLSQEMDFAQKIADCVDSLYNKGAMVVWISLLIPAMQTSSISLETLFINEAKKEGLESQRKFDCIDSTLIQWQLSSLKELFAHAAPSLPRSFFYLLEDLVSWFGYNSLLEMCEPSLDGIFQTSIFHLNYLPEEWLPFLDGGCSDLREIAEVFDEHLAGQTPTGYNGSLVADANGVSFLIN